MSKMTRRMLCGTKRSACLRSESSAWGRPTTFGPLDQQVGCFERLHLAPFLSLASTLFGPVSATCASSALHSPSLPPSASDPLMLLLAHALDVTLWLWTASAMPSCLRCPCVVAPDGPPAVHAEACVFGSGLQVLAGLAQSSTLILPLTRALREHLWRTTRGSSSTTTWFSWS